MPGRCHSRARIILLMQTDPGFDHEPILRALATDYAIAANRLIFLPVGLDPAAAAYRTVGPDEQSWFVKIKSGAAPGPGPAIALSLRHSGIESVLAPVPTRTGSPWTTADGRTLLVYPYMEATDAVRDGLTREQWHSFGRSLREVHDAPIPLEWRTALPSDACALPGIANLTALIDQIAAASDLTEPGAAFRAYLNRHESRIADLLSRARSLRKDVRALDLPPVLCHGDIHAANILVDRHGAIHLVDWDAPLLAPRERDLIFVIGSQIARPVLLHEEEWFFEGYGPVTVNKDAIVLFRLERVIDDLFEFGRELIAGTDMSNPDTQVALRIIETFFAPDGIATVAKTVALPEFARVDADLG